MSNVHPIRKNNLETAQALIDEVNLQGKFHRKRFLKTLPETLVSALSLVLTLDDPHAYASGCRILAATIARLKASSASKS